MLHSDLIPEIGCDGELIQIDERSTLYVTVARCSICATEFTYVPNSDWVTIVSPGMRKPIEQPNVGFLIGTAVCNQPGCLLPLTAGLCK